MTLPIQPGPFSFLAEAGRAAGAIGGELERRRDKERGEAQQRANNFLALRAAGLMSPEEFAKPEVQAVFDAAGFGAPSAAPTSAERVEGIRRRATAPDQSGFTIPLGDLIPGTAPVTVAPSGMSSISDEERMIAGLPSRSAVSKERVETARGNAQEQIIASGTPAQQRAVLGTPAPAVAQAAEDVAGDQLFNSLALRAVDAAITQSGGRIQPQQLMALADNAWQIAEQDAKMRGYVADEQFTKPYIMAVISSRLREQRVTDISASAATNRSANTYQDYVSLLRDQQRLAQQQLMSLPKPTPNERREASVYATRLARASTPAERQAIENNSLLKASFDKVQQYDQTVARIESEIGGYQVQLQGALSRVIPGVSETPPSAEQGTLEEPQVDQLVQRIDADPKYRDIAAAERDLRIAVQNREMSQTDMNRVLSRLQQRRGAATRDIIQGNRPAATPAPAARSSSEILRESVRRDSTPATDQLPAPPGGTR